MRSIILTVGSLILTTAVIGNAYYQKKQFYPSVVYITKSNPSMAVMYLQALVMVILTGEIMRKLFFGQLRTAELEHLIDRSWYVVTETCLAFTIFRDDFSPKFVALFTLLLFLKCFHWLADDRVDYMERSPVISTLFHIRVVSLLLVLGALDTYFVHLAYQSMVTKGASVQLVFGFEYAILQTVVFNILIKYLLHTIDVQSENPWENKAVFLLYTELAIGLVKLILYMMFVGIMLKIHTFPLFAIRPMYLTLRTFKKAFNDVIMSRRAIRNMNTLYPDVTAEELATLDNVCIICREEMVTASKKLPCNHIFHTSCLRSWFQRQQTCPTCRMDVLRLPATHQRATNAAELLRAAAAAAAAARNAGGQPPAAGPQMAQPMQGQPQPPPQINIPGFFPNVLPGPFPHWPPMPQGFPAALNQQQQPNNAPPSPPPPQSFASESASSSDRPNDTTTAGQSSSSSSNPDPGTSTSQVPPSFPSAPPMFLPPFFFPPPIPAPVPPAEFGRMTEDELHRMEGNEREHLEARVQCLRNIQIFLDAAVMQMQQYSSVVSSLSSRVGGHSGPPESTSEPQPSGSAPSTSSAKRNEEMASTSDLDANSAWKEREEANGDIPHSKYDDGAAADGDEKEQLRQRRLQRFSETPLRDGGD